MQATHKQTEPNNEIPSVNCMLPPQPQKSLQSSQVLIIQRESDVANRIQTGLKKVEACLSAA